MTASNQHGVHSPFVYDYVTKCLYAKANHNVSKSMGVLLKSIAYFKPNTLRILSATKDIENKVHQIFELNSTDNPPFDMIYADSPELLDRADLNSETNKVHNATFAILNNIHKNNSTTTKWQLLKELEYVTVSIDVFYAGILFFRKEQVKEHFKIRI